MRLLGAVVLRSLSWLLKSALCVSSGQVLLAQLGLENESSLWPTCHHTHREA